MGGSLLQGGVPGTWSGEVYSGWGVCLVWGFCSGGNVPGLGGVCSRGGRTWSQGVSAQGVYLVLGGVSTPREVYLVRYSPCGQTDACKLITLPQTSFAGGNNIRRLF